MGVLHLASILNGLLLMYPTQHGHGEEWNSLLCRFLRAGVEEFRPQVSTEGHGDHSSGPFPELIARECC